MNLARFVTFALALVYAVPSVRHATPRHDRAAEPETEIQPFGVVEGMAIMETRGSDFPTYQSYDAFGADSAFGEPDAADEGAQTLARLSAFSSASPRRAAGGPRTEALSAQPPAAGGQGRAQSTGSLATPTYVATLPEPDATDDSAAPEDHDPLAEYAQEREQARRCDRGASLWVGPLRRQQEGDEGVAEPPLVLLGGPAAVNGQELMRLRAGYRPKRIRRRLAGQSRP